MKKLFILPFLLVLLFFGACESEVPNPTEPMDVSVGLDIIPSPSEQQAGKPISFHGHLWGMEADRIEWSLIDQEEVIGFGENIMHVFQEQGFYWVGARAFLDDVLVATDTCRVTITPPDQPIILAEIFGPWHEVVYGQSTALRVHIEAQYPGDYDAIEWWYLAETHVDIFAMGRDAVFDPFRLGLQFGNYILMTKVLKEGEVVATDFWNLRVIAPDEPVELQGTMVLAPKRAEVGTPVFISAVAMGGVPSYQCRIEVDGEIIAGGFTAVFTPQEERGYQVRCFINDSVGQSIIMEDMIDAYRDHDTIVTWSVSTDLAAGPWNGHDSEEMVINQGQHYSRVWFLVRMDVRNEDRETMTLEFVYTNGTRRYWQIPDVIQDRPAEFVVDGGEAWIESVVEVNWYYPGGTTDLKCDGLNRIQEISGSYQLPAQYQGLRTIKVNSSAYKPIVLSN